MTNNDGALPSQVSANKEAGFSIITYDGNNTSTTVGHGLDKAPEFILAKCYSNNATDWIVYHPEIPDPDLPTNNFIRLNESGGITAGGAPRWNSIDDTTIGIGTFQDIGSNESYVMYAWHSVPGYSAIGSYDGNSTDNGPFVYLGFKPAWVMIKNSNTGPWMVFDSTRNTTNNDNGLDQMQANTPDAEINEAQNNLDFLSNGFKIRGSGGNINGSAPKLYVAFAENPFQSPTTAR